MRIPIPIFILWKLCKTVEGKYPRFCGQCDLCHWSLKVSIDNMEGRMEGGKKKEREKEGETENKGVYQ